MSKGAAPVPDVSAETSGSDAPRYWHNEQYLRLPLDKAPARRTPGICCELIDE